MIDKSKDITLEIVDHYPDVILSKDKEGNVLVIDEDPNAGTFHVYWTEMEMDLRGCRYYFKTPTCLFVMLPSRKAYDKESKRELSYPEISFTDQEYNIKFLKMLKETFVKYAASKFLSYSPRKVKANFFRKKDNIIRAKPEKPKEIKSTGTFTKYKNWRDVKSKSY